MKILILDDMTVRHERFKKILKGHNLFHAYSFYDAQDIILNNDIEMACLDHDLGDEDPEIASFYYDSQGRKRFYTGENFAWWLSNQDRDRIPNKILIHSWNPEGASRMQYHLLRVKDVEIKVLPFPLEPK